MVERPPEAPSVVPSLEMESAVVDVSASVVEEMLLWSTVAELVEELEDVGEFSEDGDVGEDGITDVAFELWAICSDGD
ncbi:MAG: hypothetical protein Q9157_004596 [Trypethelium eluteriae]